MKTRIFIALVCIQLVLIYVLIFNLRKSNRNTLGVSTNVIDSKKVKKEARSLYRHFYEPLTGTSDEPDPRKLGLSQRAVYTVNPDTLYETKEYKTGPHPYTYRILVLGDSFTSGLYINTKDNWTEVLENKLSSYVVCGFKRFEVINLGVPGYDPNYEVERYGVRGTKYKPDLVLLFLTDPYRNTEKILEFMENYRKTHINADEDSLSRAAFAESDKSISSEEKYRYQFAALKKLRLLYNGKIVILLPANKANPAHFEYAYDFASQDRDTQISEVENTMTNPPLRCKDGFHPNETGHQVIAENVLHYLMENIDFCSFTSK